MQRLQRFKMIARSEIRRLPGQGPEVADDRADIMDEGLGEGLAAGDLDETSGAQLRGGRLQAPLGVARTRQAEQVVELCVMGPPALLRHEASARMEHAVNLRGEIG